MSHENQEDYIHSTGSGLSKLKNYLTEFVYGSIDGSVTTFAVVAGAAGAELDTHIVLILGFANLIADGFSMSVGNYLSVKSEVDNYRRHEKVEYWEVDNLPEKEKEEIREIYKAKGFEGSLLEEVVNVISSDKDRWVDVMMKEELEMVLPAESAVKTASVTFLSFVVIGFIPLLTYVINFFGHLEASILFPLSCLFTSLAFILIGYLKSYVNDTNKLKSVVETLLLGGIAATLSFIVGDVLEKLLS